MASTVVNATGDGSEAYESIKNSARESTWNTAMPERRRSLVLAPLSSGKNVLVSGILGAKKPLYSRSLSDITTSRELWS
jgi:hypothetical protein